MRWNENFGTTGAWDPTGCTLIETNAVETKCECVHFGAQVWQMILYYPNPKCIFILPYSALTHCWNWQNGHDNHNLSADIDLMGYQFRDRKKLKNCHSKCCHCTRKTLYCYSYCTSSLSLQNASRPWSSSSRSSGTTRTCATRRT